MTAHGGFFVTTQPVISSDSSVLMLHACFKFLQVWFLLWSYTCNLVLGPTPGMLATIFCKLVCQYYEWNPSLEKYSIIIENKVYVELAKKKKRIHQRSFECFNLVWLTVHTQQERLKLIKLGHIKPVFYFIHIWKKMANLAV